MPGPVDSCLERVVTQSNYQTLNTLAKGLTEINTLPVQAYVNLDLSHLSEVL